MTEKTERRIGFKINVLAMMVIMLFVSVNPLFAFDELNNEPLKIGGWEVMGPNGGDVRSIVVDPRDKDKLYISTLDGQVHASSDAGKTWRLLVNLNRPQLILDNMIVDPRDSDVIYVSGHRHKEPGGFFKTTDGGSTWKEAKELKKESIHSMVQSSLDPDVIMVGTIGGIWISKDSGDDWKKIQSPTMPSNVGSLAIDPRTVDTIYAGTWWRPYKTTDGGKNWRLIKEGMIDDSDVFAVTIDQKNPDHVVASACSGIYESFNQGERWVKIQGIPAQSRRTRDILQHPTMPGTLYAATTEGFWMKSSAGKWSLTTQKDLEINSIAVHRDAPNRVFIGTNNYGVMVSNDGGKNFSQTNDNFTSRFTYSVITDIERPNRIYATTHNTATGGGFVFVSNDGGSSWQPGKNLDINRVSPFSIIQDRVKTDTLYLATNIGMFTSIDRGNSWKQITAPKPVVVKKAPVRRRNTRASAAKSKTAVKAPPVKPAPVIAPDAAANSSEPKLIPILTEKVKVLSYTEDGKNGIYAGTDKGLYRTYDITKGWEKISFGDGINENIFVIYSTPQQPETVWVGTSISGVVVSRDNGKTWAKTWTNTGGGAPDAVPVSSIAVDPKRPEYVYVGTSQTFFLSRDGGKSWERRGGNLPLGNYTSILINPNNNQEIYVSSALESDGGIYFSKNAGMNWSRVDSKEMKIPSRRIWSMTFDPNDSNRIFAGTHSSGIYLIERKAATASTETVTRPRVFETGN
ncbi:MAG TPA: YCF48-related protein [Pyrinomonadaceae bacterium]|nr:YCF48-related protein [Pyrinomonadaceae bacterium]